MIVVAYKMQSVVSTEILRKEIGLNNFDEDAQPKCLPCLCKTTFSQARSVLISILQQTGNNGF